jgi:type I restriction enzyme S subunit
MANANDIPEGFRVTELGVVPASWSIISIGKVATLKSGGTPSTVKEEYWKNGNIPWINSGALRDSYVIRPTEFITKLGLENSSAKLFPINTIVIALTGATTGRVGLLTIESSTNQSVVGIFPNDRFSPHYLFYYLMFSREKILNLRSGAAQPHINKAIVEQFLIPLPPLPEQRAIAQVLRTVQEAREKTEAVIEATKALKKAMMKHLFTYGPVPLEEAAKVSLNETEIGMVPEYWEIELLGNCATVQTGIAKGKKLKSNDVVRVPYLRVANVQDGYLDLTELKQISIEKSDISKYLLQEGDVLLTEGGDFDKLGRGFIWHGQIPQCVHQNHIFAVRVNKNRLNPGFFAYQIQSEYGKKYFLTVAHRTTHLACINSSKLKNFPVIIPPHTEQQLITHILSSIDLKIITEESRRQALDALFKTLLRDLMIARIRVNSTSFNGKEPDNK